jgi:exopolysaccharide biosynthesis polyprenyl glycosylphosphotransferase
MMRLPASSETKTRPPRTERARLLVERLRRVGLPGQGIPQGPDTTVARRRDAAYRRSLGVADAIAVAAALAIAVVFVGAEGLRWGSLLVVPLVVLLGKAVGLYDRDEHLLRKTTLDEIPHLFQVATLTALLVWLGQGVVAAGSLGRAAVVTFLALLILLAVSLRTLARFLVGRHAPVERCLVLGDPDNVLRLAHKLDEDSSLHAKVVGWIPLDGDEPQPVAGIPVLGSVGTLGLAVVEHNVERAVIVPPPSGGDELLEHIRLVKALGVKVSLLPGLVEIVESAVELDEAQGTPLLGVRRYGLSRSSLLLKRVLDLVGSIAGLVVLAPFFALVAVTIKLGSPGPVFFRQQRVGRNGREFEMLKFRTMEVGAERRKAELSALNEAEGLFKIVEDPRVTQVGRWLRRTSLDELPQLLNVLRGDMSLVGPRPLVSDDDRRVEGWDRRRLLIPPGMTGPWQVMGSARIPLRDMVKIDYLYAANWSLWLDVKVLVRTLAFVLRRRGM